jgi:hypothetical protein
VKSRMILIVYVCVALCLPGCGGTGGTATNGGGSPIPTFTGNWNVGGPVLGAFLSQNGELVSGAFMIAPGCNQGIYTVQVSGSLANGQLTLNGSTPTPSLNLSVSASVSTALNSFEGQFSLSGYCGSYQTLITASQVPSLAGNWKGTVTSATDTQAVVAGTIFQAAPDSTGFPVLSGNVTISGSPCFTTGVLAGNQIGRGMIVAINTTNGTINIPNLQDAQSLLNIRTINGQLQITYLVEGGNCNGDYGTGNVTLQ